MHVIDASPPPPGLMLSWSRAAEVPTKTAALYGQMLPADASEVRQDHHLRMIVRFGRAAGES